MEYLYLFVLIAGLVQVGIYFFNRKRKESDTAILEKYNIKSRGDLFKIINSHHLPEGDRELLEKYYQNNS